jgi:hypothetical protein
MGGDAATVAKLNTFFTSLNATRNLPYDWAGNEPSLWTPWEYDYFAAPSQTQGVVRDITDTLYSDTPVDEPGNDDLGAIASWYVWAAIGMYPVTPGTANLALASPLFPQVVMTLPDGHQLVIDAPAASASTPYVHSLTVSGVGAPTSTTSCPPAPSSGAAGWNQPWLPSSVIRTGGVLTFGLGSTPDPSWGAGPGSSPPSYGTGLLPVVGFTTPGGGTTVAAGQPTTVQLGAALAGTSSPTIQWSATGTGLDVSPASGRLVLDGPPAHSGRWGSAACPAAAAAAAPATAPASERLTLTAPTAGSYVLDIHLQTAGGTTLPPVVLDVDATG